jgi:putative oxidoreductase
MNSLIKPFTLLARVLLSAIFITAGFSKLFGFDGTVGYIASQGLPFPAVVAALTIALEILGGIAIVIGFQARVAGFLLGGFSILAAFIFHRYWAVPADQAYIQNIMFMKNLSMAGGLFLVTALGAGELSIDAKKTEAK